MSRTMIVVIAVLIAYVVGYVAFRETHVEVWDRDSSAYVIFPPAAGGVLYYLWRPLTYIYGAVTDMRFHIGPHR